MAQLSPPARFEYTGFHQPHIRCEVGVGIPLVIFHQPGNISVHFSKDGFISHKGLSENGCHPTIHAVIH